MQADVLFLHKDVRALGIQSDDQEIGTLLEVALQVRHGLPALNLDQQHLRTLGAKESIDRAQPADAMDAYAGLFAQCLFQRLPEHALAAARDDYTDLLHEQFSGLGTE